MYKKNKIEYYCSELLERDSYDMGFVSGDILNDDVMFDLFDQSFYNEVSYENDFFNQLDVYKFENKILFQYVSLGDARGYHKDWSYKKFMSAFKSVCDNYDEVYVNNYDESNKEPLYRAFFLAMLIDSKEYKNFSEAYKVCGNLCTTLQRITESRLRGISWDIEYEKNEILFCKCFLTLYFTRHGFNLVIFNHGSNEFGKDFVLATRNIFGFTEYYGVQAKAGNLNGSVRTNIEEIISQIKMSFKHPYQLIDGTEVFMSKVIIAISGIYTENAKERIRRALDEYMFSNIIFLSKKELEFQPL